MDPGTWLYVDGAKLQLTRRVLQQAQHVEGLTEVLEAVLVVVKRQKARIEELEAQLRCPF